MMYFCIVYTNMHFHITKLVNGMQQRHVRNLYYTKKCFRYVRVLYE